MYDPQTPYRDYGIGGFLDGRELCRVILLELDVLPSVSIDSRPRFLAREVSSGDSASPRVPSLARGPAAPKKLFDLRRSIRYTSGVGSLVDYDKHYRKGRGQCGEPLAAFVAFFDDYDQPRARVLDLGCGQGRDALLAARHGHEVVGVDLSEIGIAQMVEDAEAEGLDIQGIVSDVLEFRSRRKFDVVLLDRVLHLLLDDDERTACLDRAMNLTRKGGYVLIADVPKNVPRIRGYFDDLRGGWSVVKATKNYLFARRGYGTVPERIIPPPPK